MAKRAVIVLMIPRKIKMASRAGEFFAWRTTQLRIRLVGANAVEVATRTLLSGRSICIPGVFVAELSLAHRSPVSGVTGVTTCDKDSFEESVVKVANEGAYRSMIRSVTSREIFRANSLCLVHLGDTYGKPPRAPFQNGF